MQQEIEVALREICEQLDSFSFPIVMNGGIVVLRAPAVPPVLGKELNHGKSRKGRSEAGPWEGASAWQGTSRGSRAARRPGTSGEAASVLVAGLQAQYEGELDEVQHAYPGTRYWLLEEGLWLIAESSLLPGLSLKASFVVALSYVDKLGPTGARSWGFWGSPTSGYSWIGPRHTNFPDGSICAFDPRDDTWQVGDPLVELLDLYSVWAVRQLHLRVFGKWPGYQSVPHAYERILEMKEDEFCGCSNSGRRYRDCCRSRDLAADHVTEAVKFAFWSAGGVRQPPSTIAKFVLEQKMPPDQSSLWK